MTAYECNLGILYPEIVIAGCGNPLFADDGFGPAVAEELIKFTLPDNVKAVDAGLCGPQFIFTLLDPGVTRKLIIIDIADFGAKPGSITMLRIGDKPEGSIRDAHVGGIVKSLRQIGETIDVTIIGCQPGSVTYPEMTIGLSDEVTKSIPMTIRIVLDMIGV
jgi:coenzyme F420 hydrogenase subunit delta